MNVIPPVDGTNNIRYADFVRVTTPDATYRFFPDGVKNFGYYELKTGDRRRPNSKFIPLTKVYVDVVADVCLL